MRRQFISLATLALAVAVLALGVAFAALNSVSQHAPDNGAAGIARYMTAMVDTLSERDPQFRKRFTERLAAPPR